MNFKDSTKPVEERVRHLLSLMTIEEKIGQMLQPFGWKVYRKQAGGGIALSEDFIRDMKAGGIGSLYGVLRADPWTGVTLADGLSPREGAEAVNAIQRFAIEHTRLGIPILFGEEIAHGHMAIGATVFPVPLLLGSTWNTELYKEVCRVIAKETRVQGGAAGYAPVLDIVRDPRWGRTEECFGEDPYLTGEMAVAAVQGLQGERLNTDDRIIATLKHFVAYGATEGGRNAAPAHIGKQELHEIDLRPFRKGVHAGAMSIMTAYNEIDGMPCTSNKALLDDLLRRKWGFRGFVITDCGALHMLAHGHDVAASGEQAVGMALQAGVDMEMSGEFVRKHMHSALERGEASMEDLDEAVRRILRSKFELGLFEQPYADPDRAAAVIGSPAHAALARKAAAEGIILLKNDGVLPLSREAGTVAVIGPNADQPYNQLGDYTSPQPRSRIVTLLDGIRAKLGSDSDRVLYAPGCTVNGSSREGLDHAVSIAAQADVVVLAIGGSSARDFGEGTIDLKTGASVVTAHSEMECGEGIDRAELTLRGVQGDLARRLFQLGKPVIVVYINGRPIAEPWIDDAAQAVLEAWYPGQEGGHALADLLYGDVNPSGKLTISIPKHVGQLPVYYNGKRTRGRRYLEMDLQPQYPFGYGLSYTEFRYSDTAVKPDSIASNETAVARVRVTNVGDRAGAEVVQLYVSDLVSSVTRPRKELKGFRKVWLEPGESQWVEFLIGAEQLAWTREDDEAVVEPGEFHVLIGPHSEQTTSVSLKVRPEKGGSPSSCNEFDAG